MIILRFLLDTGTQKILCWIQVHVDISLLLLQFFTTSEGRAKEGGEM